jgi:hypothetical protein
VSGIVSEIVSEIVSGIVRGIVSEIVSTVCVMSVMSYHGIFQYYNYTESKKDLRFVL